MARSLSQNEAKDDPRFLNMIAWALVDPKGKFKGADVEFAISLAKRAVTITKSADPSILDTLAMAYYKKGDRAPALATEEKAAALLDKSDYPAELKSAIKADLNLIEGKPSGGATS